MRPKTNIYACVGFVNTYTKVSFRRMVVSVTAQTTEANPARRGGYAKGRARRAEIVHAASDHFAERGFTAATILDIANACGITRAGLLHYFADKEALLEAVLEDRDAADQKRFEPYIQIRGGVGVLRGMVDLAEHNRLVPGLIELFVNLTAESRFPDHPAHRYMTERYQRIRSGTARAIRAAIRAENIGADVDAEDAAVRLTALMDGLQTQWLLDPTIDMAHHLRTEISNMLTPAGLTAFEAAGREMGAVAQSLD
ncbi:TetR/AcrR family transcriptional regulator [Paenarthrobacter sp. NPDC089714]|uniref:TetR/AcrR family transcriptional regulator n=1 Tax=Paenarthrobacter sp. NPDC089714 TaxID=3364377 RepID=UPI00381D5001